MRQLRRPGAGPVPTTWRQARVLFRLLRGTARHQPLSAQHVPLTSSIAPAADRVCAQVFTVEPPYDLRGTLALAQVGAYDPCLRLGQAEAWRATRTPDGPAAERLRLLGPGRVQVETWGPGAAWLARHAPALCGADDHPSSFQPDHPLVHTLWQRGRGVRIGRTLAVFEASLGAIVQQRVAFRHAWRNWQALVHGLGDPAPGPLRNLWLPPPPERVARTPYEVFHRFGIERRRADVLRRVASVASRLEQTLELPLAAAYARLQAVPGVGPWTSARVGRVALGDPDAVCLGDLHLPHVVSWALAGEPRGSDARMLELLEPFRGHRARVQELLLRKRRTARV